MSWRQLWPIRTIGGSAVSSWIAAIVSGLGVSAPVTGSPSKAILGHGAAVTQADIRAVVPATLGQGVANLVTGTAGQASSASGNSASTVLTTILANPIDGSKLIHTKFDLTGSYGANTSAVSHPSGATDWATPANAQGANDAAVATAAGQVTTTTDAVLDLTYPDSFTKTALTITAARVDIYYAFAGAAVGAQSVTFTYSVDGTTPTVALTSAANATTRALSLTSVDLTSAINTWAKVDAFKTRARFIAPAAGTLITASVDAVVLVITATRTDLS